VSAAKRVPFADYIVHIGADGRVAEQGTFVELNDTGGYVSSLSLPKADWSHVPPDQGGDRSNRVSEGSITPHTSDVAIPELSKEMSSDDTAVSSPDGDDKEGDGMSRRTGDVQIYLYYVKSVGWWATILFTFAISGFVFSVSFPSTSLFPLLLPFFFGPFSMLLGLFSWNNKANYIFKPSG
jgi:ATP-binding cassette, subfamily C (CFTR/MRP), member 1